MKKLFSKKTMVAMAIHAVLFTGLLMIYTTAVYFGVVASKAYAVMICVAVASIVAGAYASTGQGGKIWRACIAVIMPMLLWIGIAVLMETNEPVDITSVLQTAGIGIGSAVVGAVISPGKKAPKGKQRKHNSVRRVVTR